MKQLKRASGKSIHNEFKANVESPCNDHVQTIIYGDVHIGSYVNGPPESTNAENKNAKPSVSRHWKIALISISLIVMAIISVIAVLNDPQSAKTIIDVWKSILNGLLNIMLSTH